MPHQPEGKIVKEIKHLFEREGGRAFKIQASEDSFQEIGIPDLLVCIWGQFVGAEVKQPGGKLRPAQRVVLHEIFDVGGVAAVLETVEQAGLLLRTLRKRSIRGTDSQGLCFDRGSSSRRFTL